MFIEQKKSLTFVDQTPPKIAMIKVMEYLKSNWKQTNKDILKLTMELQLEGMGSILSQISTLCSNLHNFE